MKKLVFSKKDPLIGAVLSCHFAGAQFTWGSENQLVLDDSVSLTNSPAISRHIGRLYVEKMLYPASILHRTQVDHWLSVASEISYGFPLQEILERLNTALAPAHCLVVPNYTIADYELFGALYRNSEWQTMENAPEKYPHVARWYRTLGVKVGPVLSGLPEEVRNICLKKAASAQPESSGSGVQNKAKAGKSGPKVKEEGKFVELPGAVEGEVVVRFPPEASGYLHIGHAKAALLNQHYQQKFKGKLIMRFDDTNPAKENEHFEEVILEDLKLLKIIPDRFTHTSDYFDLMIEKCEKLIRDGLAYIDDTDPETMKAEREARKESKNRNNSVDENLSLWEKMKEGHQEGLKCAVRAKIDMNSNNGCMRDPTIYRCKHESHIRTGNKYKVYPTYDFACPIVDSIEGVTHALRTTEYHDRDEQFFWFLEKLNLRKLYIYEYSRLNMNNTVLSKRKLAWFVEQGHVDGWDDPRFPTVRGILRHGMTVEGLHDFIIAQGSSRSVVNMEWDKIWTFNRKIIDSKAPRYVALEKDSLIPVKVIDAEEKANVANKHPKDPSIGTKTVWIGPKILIESADAELLKEGEKTTFINWGNHMIQKIVRENGKVTHVETKTCLDDSSYKHTLKVTWLIDSSNAPLTPAVCVHFDHLVNKSVLGKDEDFKNFIGHQTRFETAMLSDNEIRTLKKGDVVQLQRKGFYIVDQEYKEPNMSTCKPSPVVFFHVPDGHTKALATGINVKKASADCASVAKTVAPAKVKECKPVGNSANSIHLEIKEQGDKIRKLKSEKAQKDVVMKEVDALKGLKAKFLSTTGTEWTPDIDISKFTVVSKEPETKTNETNFILEINDKIVSQGNKVRELKTSGADKSLVKKEVETLLALKADFKKSSNMEWKPNMDLAMFAPKTTPNEPVKAEAGGSGNTILELNSKIKIQGDKIRSLKSDGADKSVIKEEVNALLSLKAEFKKTSCLDWKPDMDLSQFSSNSKANEPKTDSKPVGVESGSSDILNLHKNIQEQGNKIRELKSSSAEKSVIKDAVNILLSLKGEFKKASNVDWKPDIDLAQFKSQSKDKQTTTTDKKPAPSDVKPTESKIDELNSQIKAQGDKIRQLKADKADKIAIKAEVDVLLNLKQKFKEESGIDWKPDIDMAQFKSKSTEKLSAPSTDINSATSKIDELNSQIKAQGDKIRQLKADKADKIAIKAEVDVLLNLKQQFKEESGIDWKPDVDMSQFKSQLTDKQSAPSKFDELNSEVKAQGDKVRQLKADKADKTAIKTEVDVLLNLKQKFKEAMGVDWKPEISAKDCKKNESPVPPSVTPRAEKKDVKKADNKAKKEEVKADESKKQTRLGLEASKSRNLSEWFSQVITKSEMIEYYNVSGCYILRPWSYNIWDYIKDFVDTEIKKLGVENCYFPIFVAKEALEKEKTHLEDFSPEVAWVTRSGSSEMAEPIAIRPTSETVMYPAVAKWVQSHRDLPVRLNQWNNVVRWEFKQCTPFLRTREFLWQEGHSTFMTKAEAAEEVYQILDIYGRVWEELLAVPVVKGKKTEKEKFAGADFSTTTEAFISANGRAIQGATSHHLGQNFSKMFDIVYEDPVTKQKEYTFQNSWGITTRTIGVMVMVHGDDKGLVLPPRVAKLQAVIMPVGITAKVSEQDKQALYDACTKLGAELTKGGVRTKADLRDNVTPAWKFNHWELKGVPLRLEIGPREVASGQVFVVRRDTGEKKSFDRSTILVDLSKLLETIQSEMLTRAKADLDSHQKIVTSWDDFIQHLEGGNLLLAPFCGLEECEELIKKESARDEVEAGVSSMGAKSLCVPFKQPQVLPPNTECIQRKCCRKALYYTLFGRSY